MSSLGDKEITTVLLNQHKLCATSLTNLVIESCDQSLRNDVQNLLGKTFQHQKQIFDLMTQKGWYTTQPASQQELSHAKQEAGKIQSSFTSMQ